MSGSCISFLDETVARHPDKLAVVDSNTSYTFSALRDKAKSIAISIPLGLRNQPVAVYLDKSAESIATFAAVLYSGNFYVPLDVASPLERISKVLGSLAPAVVITSKQHEDFVRDCCEGMQVLLLDELPDFTSGEPGIEGAQDDRVESVIDTDPIYCMFTSGSTGEPKGVVISHLAVHDYIGWFEQCYGLTEDEVIANQSPFHFDNSVLDIYSMWKTGATLHILPEADFRFPSSVVDYLEDNRVSLIFWVPSALIRIANLRLLEGRELPALRKILFCGEVMPCRFLNYWVEHLPTTQFSNLYGPTEITDVCTYFVVDRIFADDDVLPLGFACGNTDVFLLDENDNLILGDGMGEICVRGSSLALGYWNDAEKTRLSFPQNPLNSKYVDRIYRTGDLAKYNERGELVFCGRKDSQIKLSGYRIELGEVENATLSVPQIANCAVMFNEEKQQITLFYVSERGDIGPDVIRARLQTLLPKYMVPTRLVAMMELPLTSNGKVDRVKLADEHFCG